MSIWATRSGSRCKKCGGPLTRSSEGGPDVCLGCMLDLGLEPVEPLPTPERFAHYQIVTHDDGSLYELGRGAMGVTYKARDTVLQVEVALKVIDPEASDHPLARERFLREAQAAARLRHPNVATVYFFGVTSEGQCFYAMELVNGETLEQRVRRAGPLPATDALELTFQVARALGAAEEHSLIHRDLKPANLILVKGPDLQVKVIDFGLAKALNDANVGTDLTRGGFVGTPAFASPEQFSGTEVDQRSDYYSLGTTLWYSLCGKPPFTGGSIPEIVNRQLSNKLPIEHLKAAGVPQPIQNLSRTLLASDPADRPQTAEALSGAIAHCKSLMTGPKASPSRALSWVVGSCMAALLLAVGTFLWWRNATSSADSLDKSIAVLPFENLSDSKDNAYFADGVQDEILTHLAQVAQLKVIGRASVMVYRDPLKRPSTEEIGKALGVAYILNGSVRRQDNRIRVSSELEEARTGREVWAEQYDRDLADVFTIQTDIAQRIVQELQAKLTPSEKSSLEEPPTKDIAAYELYLKGREIVANEISGNPKAESLLATVRLLDEATSRDPNFAMAWCQLAEAHNALYAYNYDHTPHRLELAKNALQKAIQLQPDLGEAHLAAALIEFNTTRDFRATQKELELAARTMPNSSRLLIVRGKMDSLEGKWADSFKHLEAAYELDPKKTDSAEWLTRYNDQHRRYQEAYQWLAKSEAAGLDPDKIRMNRAFLLWHEKGDSSGLRESYDRISRAGQLTADVIEMRLLGALGQRKFDEAMQILNAVEGPELVSFNGAYARDYFRGWVARFAKDEVTAKAAFTAARPIHEGYVRKWPDQARPLMILGVTDAALGNKEVAMKEGRQAMQTALNAKTDIDGLTLGYELAEIYLWVGEPELAISELESLKNAPMCLFYGDLRKDPTWDALQGNPRFEQLLASLGPITPVNTPVHSQ